MKFIFLVIAIFMVNFLASQTKIIVSSIPENTPKNAAIYLASSINNWNPKDEKFKLKKEENGYYILIIPDFGTSEKPQNVEYKFTLGSWGTVEGNQNGNAISNRSFKLDDRYIIENKILSWQNPVKKQNTISGNVKILSENFSIPQLKTTRKIWIYLPPGYENSKKKYPVIYMEDGQNIFNDATSFSGEWKVDETMENLSKKGEKEAIIVGIENGRSERLKEYSPWKNAKYGGGKGEKYAEFIAGTLKPYIDNRYRTLPQAKNTALVGSSMGGLISFYIGIKYPQKFGRLGIFSPSFWFAEEELHSFLNKNNLKLKKTKFYFLAGKKESEEMVSDVEEIVALLEKKGVPQNNIKTKLDEDGTHSESYWAREFPEAFLWLMK